MTQRQQNKMTSFSINFRKNVHLLTNFSFSKCSVLLALVCSFTSSFSRASFWAVRAPSWAPSSPFSFRNWMLFSLSLLKFSSRSFRITYQITHCNLFYSSEQWKDNMPVNKKNLSKITCCVSHTRLVILFSWFKAWGGVFNIWQNKLMLSQEKK